MSDILVVEKIVAPHASWATLHDEFPVRTWNKATESYDVSIPMRAIKVVFDRSYPYIWVASEHHYAYGMGLALTMEDVERAAIFDDATDALIGFNTLADGIFPLQMSGIARCIAMGPRRSFYILPSYLDDPHTACLTISAQNDAICPFASTRGPISC